LPNNPFTMRLIAHTGDGVGPDGGNRRALALVSWAHPEVTPSQWRRFARFWARTPRRKGGLVLIEDPRRYVHALFRYEVDAGRRPSLLTWGRSLRVCDLVVADLTGTSLRSAIDTFCETLARELDCPKVIFDGQAPTLTTASRCPRPAVIH